ncbi:hypothetical protein D3C79_882430 [compost metagenome]
MLLPQMVRQHRPVGRDGVARRAGDIATHRGVPDISVIPTHTMGQQKLIAVGYRRKHLGKAGVHALGHGRAGLGQQPIQVRRLE